MDDNADGYHFTIDDQTVSEALSTAAPFVRGVDPCDLDPLATVVDPDALNRLFSRTDDGWLTFTWNGLEIEVHADGDIHVTDSGPPAHIRKQLEPASNILLLVPPRNNVACHELVTAVQCPDVNVLEVLFSSSVDGRIARWVDRRGDTPANVAILTVGDIFSSSSRNAGFVDPSLAVGVTTMADCRNLDAINGAIEERLSAWTDNHYEAVLCFESVTDIVHATTTDRSVRFFRELTSRVGGADAVAHYHLDPTETNLAVLDELVPLFDAVVEVDEEGPLLVSA